MTRKVYIVEDCADCPNLDEYGEEYQCRELGRVRLWKGTPKNIPRDCPLPNAPKEEEA